MMIKSMPKDFDKRVARMIAFTIPISPVGQMRSRSMTGRTSTGKIFSRHYKHKKQELRESVLLTLSLPYKPLRPLDGPLLLGLRCFLPIPRSWPKHKQEAARGGFIRPTSKPDWSNLQKHIEDVYNGIFWKDDAQIVGPTPGSGKFYGEPARWEVEIVPIEEMP